MQGSGDDRTNEWLLDLRSIALQPPPAPSYEPPVVQTPQYQAQPSTSYSAAPVSSSGQGPQHGGVLSRFTGSNFGQSMSSGVGMGVGFGLADSLINSIFGR